MPANIVNSYPAAYLDSDEDRPLLKPLDSSLNSTSKGNNPGQAKTTPRRCILNSLTMALAYFLAFAGFAALRNLESSIDRLGELSLSIVGISAVVGAYLSPLIVYFLGEKGSVIGMWTFMTCLVGANFYPASFTLFPAAGLFGFMAGPGWTSQLSYTTNTAIKYAELVGKNEEQMVEMSNGVFYLAYSGAQVVGNLISSLVLYGNATELTPNASVLSKCGVNFCPILNGKTSPESQIPSKTLYSLLAIFIAGPTLAGLASTFLLDPIKQFLTEKQKTGTDHTARKSTSWKTELLAPVKIYRDFKMVLLIPVLYFSGMEQILMFAGFNEAFVSCAIGVDYVGYVMMCWGLVSAISSFISGLLAKCLGRAVLCTGALVLSLGLQVFFYYWDVTKTTHLVFFLVSGAWGLTDGVIQTQLSALLGLVFKENHNSAFANFRILSYLGFAVTYASAAVMCQVVEIYVTSGLIAVSVVTYIAVEIMVWKCDISYDSHAKNIRSQHQEF